MTAAYTPRVGDKITVSKTGVVSHANQGDYWFTLDDGHTFEIDAFDICLVKAAPVPFEVGKPLTPEMGEPPIGSVIRRAAIPTLYERQGDGWYSPGSTMRHLWSSFEGAMEYNTFILLDLGGVK